MGKSLTKVVYMFLPAARSEAQQKRHDKNGLVSFFIATTIYTKDKTWNLT